MALLDLVIFPDERLRRKTRRVNEFDDELKRFVADLAETMYVKDGLGLAAPQVGDDRRVFVIDDAVLKQGENVEPNLIVFVNPELELLGEKIPFNEACLSFPEESVETVRHTRVICRAQNEEGEPFEIEATLEERGLFAIALQHEFDHLEGRLLIDFLSPLKRTLMRRRLIKYKKELERS